MKSLWWLASTQNQMSTALSQFMAMALYEQSNNTNLKILGEPKMMEDLPVLRIIRMDHKFPLLTQNWIQINHPQIFMDMPLTQKGDL